MKFGDKLSQLRRKNGLSQEELGEQLNITRQTISKWELGQSKPDTDKLMEISKLLNVDFNQLIDDEVTIQNDNISNISSNYDEPRPRKWLLVLLVIIAIIIVIILANKIVIDKKNKDENGSGNFWGIFEIFKNFGNIEMDSFNSELELYVGTRYGSHVSMLLDTVITNNKTNSDHTLVVVFGDVQTSEPDEIKNIKQELQTFNQYEVSVDYDENGYANKITIEASSSENNSIFGDDFNASQFNNKLELYDGTQYGTAVSKLLDTVITNNKTNSDHILTVIHGTTNTTDETEIRNIKKSLDDWTQYEVIFDYDENGYVMQITIEN